MKGRLLFLLAFSVVLISGCQDEPKTVSWYTEHPKERQAQIDICKNNPGKLKDNPDCINAFQSMLTNSAGKPSDYY